MRAIRVGISRRLAVAAAAAAGLLLIALVAVGWYYSSLLRSGALVPDYSTDDLNLVVIRMVDGSITLAEREGENVDDLDDEELWGLDAESGYGQVGDVLATANGEVTREFELLAGTVEAGDYARLDSFAFEGDPMSARGLDFETVVAAG